MYKTPKFSKTDIQVSNWIEGETIEMKLERILNNKEKIESGAPIIYTERKENVIAAYNIRTDRFEVAIDATEAIAKSYTARREEKGKLPEVISENGEAETIQTT